MPQDFSGNVCIYVLIILTDAGSNPNLPMLVCEREDFMGVAVMFLVGTSLPVGLGNRGLGGDRQVAPFVSVILARY